MSLGGQAPQQYTPPDLQGFRGQQIGLLQALLGLPTPDYRHHRLIAGRDGRRFAKRDKSATLRNLRESGRTPEEVRTLAGF